MDFDLPHQPINRPLDRSLEHVRDSVDAPIRGGPGLPVWDVDRERHERPTRLLVVGIAPLGGLHQVGDPVAFAVVGQERPIRAHSGQGQDHQELVRVVLDLIDARNRQPSLADPEERPAFMFRPGEDELDRLDILPAHRVMDDRIRPVRDDGVHDGPGGALVACELTLDDRGRDPVDPAAQRGAILCGRRAACDHAPDQRQEQDSSRRVATPHVHGLTSSPGPKARPPRT